jgi:hypothetical protein
VSETRVGIEEFGKRLLATGDLDPLYLLLNKAKDNEVFRPTPESSELYDWVLAYWCFYHAGVASYVASAGSDFAYWDRFLTAAINNQAFRFPRGKERRHFRGKFAVKTVTCLDEKCRKFHTKRASYFLMYLHDSQFSILKKKVLDLYGFGDWMAFKVADMYDAVLDMPVDFSDCELDMYEAPVKGAEMYLRERPGFSDHGLDTYETPIIVDYGDKKQQVKTVVEELKEIFKNEVCPHDKRRGIQLQEIETILCKWKSHMNGHYEIGCDIVDLKHSLAFNTDRISKGLIKTAGDIWPC